MKVSDMEGAALNWAVAKCEGAVYHGPAWTKPSTDWGQGGPIIERAFIQLNTILNIETGAVSWFANMPPGFVGQGPTPLISAMRCYVASKLGDDIDLPEELK
jgi:hypothetical protein